MIDRVPEELWTEVHKIVQEAVIKNIPKKKKCKKAKWFSDEALQIVEKRRQTKGKEEKERYTHLNSEFQEQPGDTRKPFKRTIQKNRGKQQNRKASRSLQENYRCQGNISCKDGHNKGQNGMDLTEADDVKKRWQEYTEELYTNDLHDQITMMV